MKERTLAGFPKLFDQLRVAVLNRSTVLPAILLCLFAVALLSLAYSRGITQDEVIHIPAGYYQVLHRDFRMNNVTPPAVKTFSAAPAVLVGIRPVLPEFPETTKVDYETRDYQIAKEFWTANSPRFTTILFSARVGAVGLTVILGFLIFVLARRLFGKRTAVIALVLFILEPNILAHGHIVHADVIAALALIFFCFVAVNYWVSRSLKWTLLLGVATGIALIAKFTLLPFAGVFLILLLARWHGSRQLLMRNIFAKCGAVFLCLLILNAAYLFEPRRPADAQTELANVPGIVGVLANRLPQPITSVSILLPTDFIQGFSRLSIINQNGHDAYLLGRYSVTGWWYYFPVAFLLKATIPFLLLTLAAAVWAVARFIKKQHRPLVPLVAALLFYSALLTTSRINIGVRHILPLFPFMFIICAAFMNWLIERRQALGLTCAVVLLAAMGFEAARSWPAYMSYMNQFTSGHPRWTYLGDSNIEWGQDTTALAAYLNARGIARIRGAMLCGEVALPRYGIEYVNLL